MTSSGPFKLVLATVLRTLLGSAISTNPVLFVVRLQPAVRHCRSFGARHHRSESDTVVLNDLGLNVSMTETLPHCAQR
jgi:hypothetical protein